ncbi:uncharacterized protein SPSK_09810 [Sporothrix schenckii 1099-18]|uniref:CFEM domain-containing protein n=2 Tax=Sporothrix schenckii TaxID=29908 RepID=U7PXF5_SPOS1|nr:uncharacterized protein SPSK_09810 [Sporothrix schenckii 1099-18]ERT00288.1 hypothetical protein HMPREF1624_03659 [Sporothrix schenckii ATCC 58251]KJR85247.1 hypothetical protein SPSK_09810 [Sporothrix schenckii 1099-18]
MKSAVVALALAGAAVAQNLSGEPECASSCLISAISKAGCAPNDVACQCGPTESAIASLVAPCLINNCHSAAELIQAQSAGYALCAEYSKTAGAPASASASATTTSGSTSATGSSGSAAATTSTTSTKSSSGSLATVTTSSSKTTSRGIGSNVTVTTGTKTVSNGGGGGTGPSTSASTAGAATLGAGVLAAFVGLIAAL